MTKSEVSINMKNPENEQSNVPTKWDGELKKAGLNFQTRLKEMIRQMEQEVGVPIQATLQMEIRRQDEKDAQEGDLVVGSFYERPVEVKRVPNLDSKFVRDIELLERNYSSLNELIDRIEHLSVLYVDAFFSKAASTENALKARKIIKKMVDEQCGYVRMDVHSILADHLSMEGESIQPPAHFHDQNYHNLDKALKNLIPLEEASKALSEAGIEHLLYYMRTNAEGRYKKANGEYTSPTPIALYHAIHPYDHKPIAKVADIVIPLLEP